MVKISKNPPDSYEAAVKELEGLLANLEGGQLPLEESIQTYRRGADLIRYCQAQLADAEQRIKVLEGESLQDFQGNVQPD
jgi:exodeoxyribonuclease VII small subunit